MSEQEWTPEDVARVQRAEAKANNGKIQRGSLAAKAQRALAKQQNATNSSNGSGQTNSKRTN